MCDLSSIIFGSVPPEAPPLVLACRCGRPGTADLASARQVAVVLQPANGSRLSRLLWLATARIRIRAAHGLVQRAGAERIATFAVWPTLERATVAYEIGTSAAAYAERWLINGSRSLWLGPLQACAGFDPLVQVVVVIGQRRVALPASRVR